MINIKFIHDNFTAIVVPCSSVKLSYPMRADTFYCGNLFRLQYRFAELTGLPIYILSSKFGLVNPHTVIEPYDLIWSLALKHSGKVPYAVPVATEKQRALVADEANTLLRNEEVITLCSVKYKPYFPEWVFYNDLISDYYPQSSKDIHLIRSVITKLIREHNGTL